MPKGRRKKRLKHGIETADGSAIFPTALWKMEQIRARSMCLLDSRNANQFNHPEVYIRVGRITGLTIDFIYEDYSQRRVIRTDGKGNFTYVDKDLLDECLDFLKREQLLEDLADI